MATFSGLSTEWPSDSACLPHSLCPLCPPRHIRPLTSGTWATPPLPGVGHTLPLMLIMGGQLGPAFPRREIPDPTKFQIPWPYLAPFCLAFDGLPGVGGRTSPPSERLWGPPTFPPLKLPGCVMGLSHGWNTQVVYTESKTQQGIWGRGGQWAWPDQASSTVEPSHSTPRQTAASP